MSNDILNFTLAWMHNHLSYAWLLIFTISAMESIAVIGTIVPGTITMTAIGTLVGSGVIPLWSSICWSALGAIAGDGISYFLGKYCKQQLQYFHILKDEHPLMQRSMNFFRDYGWMSVFIGRFIGPIRALIPLIAGMMAMPTYQFLTANILSAALWAPLYMLPGFIIGSASLELPPSITASTITFSIGALLGLWITWHILTRSLITCHHYLDLYCARLWHRSKCSHLRTIMNLVQHHHHASTPRQLRALLYSIILLLLFTILAGIVVHYTSANLSINQVVAQVFANIRNPEGLEIARYFSLLGQYSLLVIAALIVSSFLLIKKQYNLGIHITLVVGIGLEFTSFIKKFIASPRPLAIPEYSFPSGHTMTAMLCYGGLILIAYPYLHQQLRKAAVWLTAIIIMLIAGSRLYLGVHWATDIIAGFLLGGAILLLARISYCRYHANIVTHGRNILIIGIALIIGVGIQVSNYHHNNYVPKVLPRQVITLDQWQHQNRTTLPTWSITTLGIKTQVINLEFLGDLAAIKQVLIQNNWQEPHQRTWYDVLVRLTGITSTKHLPLITPRYQQQLPQLVLIKQHQRHLLVLRLWATSLNIANQTLWVGTLGLVPSTYSWLKPRPTSTIMPDPNMLFDKPSTTITKQSLVLDVSGGTQNLILLRQKP